MLGLTVGPGAGDTFIVAPDDRIGPADRREAQAVERGAHLAKRRKRISLEDFKGLEHGKVETLNLILKGDVSGSVEALEDALLQLDVGEEVDLQVIDRGVGAITENDVMLATVVRRGDHRLQRPAEGRAASWPSARASTSLLLGHLPGDRGGRGGAARACSSRSTKRSQLGTAEVREVFR